MQQELIEMLEEIIQYVEVWNAHDQGIIDRAEALIEKAKNNAPDVPQGEPVACLVRQRTLRTRAAIAHDRQDHFSEWSDWCPATLKYGTAVTDPRRNSGPEHLFEMLPLVLSTPAPAPAQEVGLTDEQADAVSMALRRAWQLGQTYWQQADSDYISQHKKSEETQRKFEKLCDDTISALRAKENKL